MGKVDAIVKTKVDDNTGEVVNTIKEIEIKVRHIKVDAVDFDAFKALQKDGRWIDCKFKMAVDKIPTEDCIIVVNVEDLNIQKNKKFPCLWVEKVISIKPLTPFVKNTAEINDMF